MSRRPNTYEEPGPECYCGSELKSVPLPHDLQDLSGKEGIWVHAETGDTQCYPEEGNAGGRVATAEPI